MGGGMGLEGWKRGGGGGVEGGEMGEWTGGRAEG